MNLSKENKKLIGCTIKCIHMDDPFNPVPDDTEGKIYAVDAINQIHVKWNNGQDLAIIPGVDKYEIIEEI